MPTSSPDACKVLRELGSPEELQAETGHDFPRQSRPRINSHIHLPPNFSAFDTVEHAIGLAREQSIGILGVSNYYDFGVYGNFTRRVAQAGIFPLFGLEVITLDDDLLAAGTRVNDPGNPGKIYFCGKGITQFEPMNAEATRLMGVIRAADSRRMAAMIASMESLFSKGGLATGLTEQAVIARIVKRHACPAEAVYIQERHIAQAFQEVFFENVAEADRAGRLAALLGEEADALRDAVADHVKLQNLLRSRLMKAGKPAFVAETFVDFDHARQLILQLGGIPCYPVLADGASPVCGFEDPARQLVENIQSRQVHLAEFIPLRNKPEVLTEYVTTLRRAGLVITAGTEHNTLDLVPIEPTCLAGAPVPEAVAGIFYEGACVVAAHQFLNLHGQCGYVDAQGRLNPEFDDPEKRIAAFRGLGETLIHRYLEKHCA